MTPLQRHTYVVISKSSFGGSELSHRKDNRDEAEALARRINDSELNRFAIVIEVKE